MLEKICHYWLHACLSSTYGNKQELARALKKTSFPCFHCQLKMFGRTQNSCFSRFLLSFHSHYRNFTETQKTCCILHTSSTFAHTRKNGFSFQGITVNFSFIRLEQKRFLSRLEKRNNGNYRGGTNTWQIFYFFSSSYAYVG